MTEKHIVAQNQCRGGPCEEIFGEDESLRQTSDLDVVQGTTRVARAATYAEALRTAASQAGVSADVTLTALPGVQHDVAQAIRVAGLARHVAGPDLFPFAQAV